MPYESLLVKPMRDELTRLGVQELCTPAAVDSFLAIREGTALLFVNSVCGCAAGNARPALALALENQPLPDRTASVFAGQDPEATARVRTNFAEIPASSPSIFLLKEGEVVMHLPRQAIEGRDKQTVARDLMAAFDIHCRNAAE